MRARIAILAAASLLSGCCAGGYPPVSGASPAPFDAFQASMRLAVGMPTDVADSRHRIGSGLRSGDELRHPRRIRMAMPAHEVRLLRQQPAPGLYRADAGRPRRRQLLVGAQGLIRTAAGRGRRPRRPARSQWQIRRCQSTIGRLASYRSGREKGMRRLLHRDRRGRRGGHGRRSRSPRRPMRRPAPSGSRSARSSASRARAARPDAWPNAASIFRRASRAAAGKASTSTRNAASPGSRRPRFRVHNEIADVLERDGR